LLIYVPMNKQTILPILLLIILLGALGYFIYNDLTNIGKAPDNEENTSTTTSDTITDGENRVDASFGEEIPEEIIPGLDREFTVPEIYSEEIKNNTMEQYQTIVSALKEDPALRGEWLQLALFRNSIEDYKGAEEIWLFMTQVWSFDHVAYGNLGNLYYTNLLDIEKSKDFYVQAIEKNPAYLNYYDNLYNIFFFKLEDRANALLLLEQGSNLLMDEIYFPLKKAEYYRDTGDVVNAKKFFKETVALAETLGLIDIQNHAESELEKL